MTNTMKNSLPIRNVRPWGAALTDILIHNGRITRIAPGIIAEGTPVEEGDNAIILPGFVEAHAHLYKSLLRMGWRTNQAGPSLMDKIENERRLKKEWNIDPARQSARQVVLSLSHGSTVIRILEGIKVARCRSAPEPKIYNRFFFTYLNLSLQLLSVESAGRRIKGHIDNCRNATGCRTLAPGFKTFPFFPSGFIEVNMRINDTREYQLPPGIDNFLRGFY